MQDKDNADQPSAENTPENPQSSQNFLLESLKMEANRTEKVQKGISYSPENLLDFEEVKKLDEQYILNTYSRMPVCFSYGSGEFLYDSKGNEYIDFLSGIAVTGMGHAHADLVDTLLHQADLIWHSSNLFYNQQQALLARALVEVSFKGKVFFTNSGTEANEAAIKLIRAYGQEHNKKTILSLNNSFHGRTFGAMSATGQPKIRNGFGPLLEDFSYLDVNDIHGLESAFNDGVAGIILEPVLGEGGVIPLLPEFMKKARELCDQHKALLVVDEIQTGIGRTGKYFAYQHYDIEPDAMTVAKGLGGGFPIGALVVAERHKGVFQPGMHGSTFGGNHLATAVGYEVLRLMEANKVLENVETMSSLLFNFLENLQAGYPDKIKEVRGLGLLIGIVLRDDIAARPLVEKALSKHLVIGRAADNVLRLAPPLIVREGTIQRAISKLEELIKELP